MFGGAARRMHYHVDACERRCQARAALDVGLAPFGCAAAGYVLIKRQAPLIDADPAALLESQALVDRVAQLGSAEHADAVAERAGIAQRRMRYSGPNALL